MFRILTDQVSIATGLLLWFRSRSHALRQILTNSSALKTVPTRFDRALLKDFAQVSSWL